VTAEEKTFTGRVAVITGAAQGIGAAIAGHLAERGARIVAVDLSDSVESAIQALPGEGHVAIQKDLRADDAAAQVIIETVEKAEKVDILVNSAGVAMLEPAIDMKRSTWDTTLDINLTASFLMAQAAARVMVKNGYGRIVNLASQASVIALDQHVAYTASKAAIVGVTKVLAAEWARFGVTVNAVSPTVVDTELGRVAWKGEAGENMKRLIPVGRFAQPAEIAALVAYLASEDAAMVTGANVVIDGGYSIV
jgi:NAD(P)-dependent dehydrogenase (short-subunit alcohol dehydrogenase family)